MIAIAKVRSDLARQPAKPMRLCYRGLSIVFAAMMSP
jgi:hypothetical protein